MWALFLPLGHFWKYKGREPDSQWLAGVFGLLSFQSCGNWMSSREGRGAGTERRVDAEPVRLGCQAWKALLWGGKTVPHSILRWCWGKRCLEKSSQGAGGVTPTREVSYVLRKAEIRIVKLPDDPIQKRGVCFLNATELLPENTHF